MHKLQQIVICLIRRGEVQRNQGLPPRHTSQQTHNKTRPPTSSAVAHEKQRVPKQEERQLSLATARTTKHLCPITHSTKNRPKFPLRRLVSQKNFPLARPVQLSAADQFGISFVIGIRNQVTTKIVDLTRMLLRRRLKLTIRFHTFRHS